MAEEKLDQLRFASARVAQLRSGSPQMMWRKVIELKGTRAPFAVAAVLACIFLGLVVVAKATGHWQTNLPCDVYMGLVSHAREAGHPGM